jgi:hypothetical protein
MAAGPSRPAGIVVIAILTVLSGLLYVVLSTLVMLAAGMLEGLGGALGGAGLGRPVEMPVFVIVLLYAGYFLGVFTLAAGYGLLTFEPWGPGLTRTVWLISVPIVLVLTFGIETTAASVISGLLWLVTIAAVIYYLSTPEVQALY